MSRRIFLALGLVAALAGGSAEAAAQQGSQGPGIGRRGPGGPGGPGRPGGLRRAPGGDLGLRGVDLSDAQREQVKAIMKSHKEAFRAARVKLGEAHRAFAGATRGEIIDEAAVRARSAAVAGAMADEAILAAKVRSEVRGILTAEQLQKITTREASIRQRSTERRQKRPQGQ
ncbi:MAG TPA: periplasmic heavy metal sensor [Vicinamibacterales bacterium]|nr:periplasmic heavy metal sensor [Vicinamibacterales bacterium]